MQSESLSLCSLQGAGAKLQNLDITVFSQTPVAVGCVHPTTRQRAWSAVSKAPDMSCKTPNWTKRATAGAGQACKETRQLLREHTQNCFPVCSCRASASATCSYATSPAESRSRESAASTHGMLAASRDTVPTQNKYCYGRVGCLSKG